MEGRGQRKRGQTTDDRGRGQRKRGTNERDGIGWSGMVD